MNPLVRAVITTYNQARPSKMTIPSALNQTCPNLQVIVVDDGSTDDTPHRLQRFSERVLYLRHPNHGVATSRHLGITPRTPPI